MSSLLEIQGADDQQNPVSFTDPRVSTVIQQWRKDKKARSVSASAYDELRPVYPDWLLPPPEDSTMAVTNDRRESASIFDEETPLAIPSHSSPNASKTPSLPSTKTTPSKRRDHSWEIASRNFLAWLFVTGYLRCHATSTTPVARMLIQVVPILLPHSAEQDEQLLLWYEFLLGMAPRSLCIHSHIFMMPLRVDIRALLDGHFVIIVPTLDLLHKIDAYLRLVLVTRVQEKGKQLREELEARLANLTLDSEVSFKDLWRLLRAKKNVFAVESSHVSSIDRFKHFQDGRFNSFRLIPHPNLDGSAQPTSATFSSHLSPFAATINTLQTLAKWSRAQVPILSPATSAPHGIILEQALAPCMDPGEAADISKAFADIYAVVQQLEREFKTQGLFRPILRTSHSRRDGDGGSGGRKKDDDDDDIFNQPTPSARSGFGFGNLVFSSSSSSPPPSGAYTSAHPQAHEVSHRRQLQSHVVYARRRPLTSVPSSQWGSDTDSASSSSSPPPPPSGASTSAHPQAHEASYQCQLQSHVGRPLTSSDTNNASSSSPPPPPSRAPPSTHPQAHEASHQRQLQSHVGRPLTSSDADNASSSPSPPPPSGASTSTHPQAHEASYQRQLQSHVLYARRPLTSVPSSQWGSDRDSASGAEALEVGNDHADGDAALDIADAWRREQNTSSSAAHHPSTSSLSGEQTHAAQMHDDSQETTTTTTTRNTDSSSSAKVTMSESASSLSSAAKKVLLGKRAVSVFKSLVRSRGPSSSSKEIT